MAEKKILIRAPVAGSGIPYKLYARQCLAGVQGYEWAERLLSVNRGSCEILRDIKSGGKGNQKRDKHVQVLPPLNVEIEKPIAERLQKLVTGLPCLPWCLYGVALEDISESQNNM